MPVKLGSKDRVMAHTERPVELFKFAHGRRTDSSLLRSLFLAMVRNFTAASFFVVLRFECSCLIVFGNLRLGVLPGFGNGFSKRIH